MSLRLSRLANDRGLTLTEVVVAAAILVIAVTSVLTAITAGYTGVDLGRLHSTATFLAEQKLEEIRGFSMSSASTQGFTNVTTANFPTEAYGSIANSPQFRRTVTITDSPGGTTNTKLVTVTVFFTPQNDRGASGETSTLVSTLLSLRS